MSNGVDDPAPLRSGHEDRRAAVSVIVPTYNRAKLLEECLRSILQQTRPPTQVIVVDDGSTDDTAQRVRGFGERITYVAKENGGKPAALNLALPTVSGEWTWIFDDDDVALPTSIERRLAVAAANPRIDVVLSNHRWGRSGPGGEIEVTGPHRWPALEEGGVFRRLMQSCFTTLQGALVRTRCYREVGPFREDLVASEDYEMLLRLAHRYRVGLLDEPTFVFRRHAGQRGPRGSRYSDAQRERVFAQYDRIVGAWLRSDVPLEEYCAPARPGEERESHRRRALLHRALVMASKGLEAPMLDDYAAYAQLANGAAARMDRAESALVTSAAQQRYLVLRLLEHPDAFLEPAKSLAGTPTGKQLLVRLARGLLGVTRWGAEGLRERAKLLKLAAALYGYAMSRAAAVGDAPRKSK